MCKAMSEPEHEAERTLQLMRNGDFNYDRPDSRVIRELGDALVYLYGEIQAIKKWRNDVQGDY